NAISRLPEMARWDVAGPYTRPVCRRIVEEAGVPRHAFGQRKLAASVLFFDAAESFLSPGSLADFEGWLSATGERERSDAAPRSLARQGVLAVADGLHAINGGAVALVDRACRRLARWGRHEPRFQWLFPWAVDRAKASYAGLSSLYD